MKRIYKLSLLSRDIKVDKKLIFKIFINEIKKYKKRCKIICKNKIYEIDKLVTLPLLNFNKNSEDDSLEFKILSFIDLEEFNNEMQKYLVSDLEEKRKAFKINSDKLQKNLVYNIFKMEYGIDETKNEIKIFGTKFVNSNKDKCFIIYKNAILPLQEHLKRTPREKTGKLEIFLVDFAEINDKEFIFHKYNIIIG